jgi:hypothetical protein
VILPKQATPWYQFVGSGGVDLSSYTGKINIAFRYTGSGKNLALDFSGRRCQVLGSKLLKNKNSLFFVILFYRKAGNLLIWQIRSKQLNSGRNKWDTPQII